MGKSHDQMAVASQQKSQSPSQHRSENASSVSRSSSGPDGSNVPIDRNQEPRFGFTGVGTSSVSQKLNNKILFINNLLKINL